MGTVGSSTIGPSPPHVAVTGAEPEAEVSAMRRHVGAVALTGVLVGAPALTVLAGCGAAAPEQPLREAGPTAAPAPSPAPGATGDATQGGDDPGTVPVAATATPWTLPAEWTLDDPRLTESSGLARSQAHPDVVYTHNDRGDLARIFAMDDTGTRAVLRVDVAALDWEDIATTPDGRIWVADTGDNDGVRSTVQVVVVDEPDVLVSADVPSVSYALRYPDGPHDAEALLVDPRDDRLYLVTKGEAGGRWYRAPARLDPDGANELEPLGPAPANVTGGDVSPDGASFVLRTQGRAWFGPLAGEPTSEIALPDQPQGESVTFTPDATAVLVGSEGEASRVLRVDVPEEQR